MLCSHHIGEKGISVTTILAKQEEVSLHFLNALIEYRFSSILEKYSINCITTLKHWFGCDSEEYLNIVIHVSDVFIINDISSEEIMKLLVVLLEKDSRVTVKREIVLLFQNYAKQDYRVILTFYYFHFLESCILDR